MRKFLAVSMIVVATLETVSAQEVTVGKDESVILGAGSFTCAKFAQQYRADPVGAETYYTSWLLGFLNGLNAMAVAYGHPRRDYVLPAYSVEQAQAFMRNYCNEKPLSMYFDGAMRYALSLPTRP